MGARRRERTIWGICLELWAGLIFWTICLEELLFRQKERSYLQLKERRMMDLGSWLSSLEEAEMMMKEEISGRHSWVDFLKKRMKETEKYLV